MDSDLSKKVCRICGNYSEQVINAEKQIRVGWYCKHCKDFEQAILRERVLNENIGQTKS